MKKIFFFTAIAFSTLSSCRKEGTTFAKDEAMVQSQLQTNAKNTISIFNSSKNHQPKSVEIRFYCIVGRTFTMEGAINTTGTFTFTPENTGQAYHCAAILKSNDGFSTLIATAHCNRVTMEGVWLIESGTGIFADVEGNGKIMMGTSGCEVWEGTFR